MSRRPISVGQVVTVKAGTLVEITYPDGREEQTTLTIDWSSQIGR